MNVQDLSPSSLEHRTLSRSLQYMHPHHQNRRLREKRWIYQFSVPSFPIKSPVMWSWLPAPAPRWFKCRSCFQKWKSFFGNLPELIFVTNITNYISGEKIVMWRNFSFPCIPCISPHVEKFWEIWRNFATIYVLSCGEKLSPKIHLWRKNDKYKVCSISSKSPQD